MFLILKKDGAVRLCGDFKVNINPVLQVDQCLPRIEDILGQVCQTAFGVLEITVFGSYILNFLRAAHGRRICAVPCRWVLSCVDRLNEGADK